MFFVISFITAEYLKENDMKKNNSQINTISKERKKVADFINRVYKNSAPLLIGEAVLFLVSGLLMMFNPIEFLSSVTFIIGGVLILFGLYRVGRAFISSHGAGVWTFDVFLGLLGIVLGIVFCVYPYAATIGVMYIFVVLFLMNALRLMFFSINMLRMRFGHYWIDFFVSLGLILLAVTLLLLPNLAIGVLVWVLAVYLLMYAAADVYMFVKLSKIKRSVVK